MISGRRVASRVLGGTAAVILMLILHHFATTLPQPPTTYLKRIYVDTVVFTPHQLAALVGVFGPDRVLLGTDYPYDMAEYDPLGHIAAVEDFNAATVAALAGGNAKKLLGL